jgi:eukaryotic-like serine/threonine-protein kinase
MLNPSDPRYRRNPLVRKKLAEIVKCAFDLPPQDREAFVKERCGSDAQLLAEVESLLAEEENAERFIEQPAVEFAAEIFQRSLSPGEILDHYKIISFVHEGGTSEVYLAEDDQLGRQVAIKLLKLGLGTADVIRRFYQEERILAGLTHPNIAQLHGAAVTPNGLPYFVMEYVDGPRLDDYCRERQLSIDDRLELFQKICSAVAYAHQRLVIHRDIKPANIRINSNGETKLLDFGIAKLLGPTVATDMTITVGPMMTPEYASPEQIRGEAITTASDIYSLGMILYELLTGQKPYKIENRSPSEIARIITEKEPRRPSVAVARGQKSEARSQKLLRGDLDNIILKALRKEPERRYATVAQFSDDIRRYLEGRPVLARKGTTRYRAAKFIARNKIAVAAAALVVLALVAGIITTAWQAGIANMERAKAERRFNDVRHLAESFMFEIHDAIQNLAGSTAARRLLVSRALQYLDGLAGEAHNDLTLQRELATAYQRLGDIQGNPYVPNIGDTEGALQSYKKALTIQESLAVTHPSDQAQEDLARSYRGLGDIFDPKGDVANAIDSYRKSLAIFQVLAGAHPNDQRLQQELATAYDAYGSGLRKTDRIPERLEAFRKVVEIDKRLLAQNPENRRAQHGVAIGLMKLGDGWRQNKIEAVESLRKSRAFVESLAASDPTNARAQRDFGVVSYRLGEVLSWTGDYAAALDELPKSLAIYERLAAADPKDLQARFDIAGIHTDMAEAFVNSGDLAHGMDESAKSLSMFRDLSATDPANMDYLRYLGLCYELLGKAHAVMGANSNLPVPQQLKEWRAAQESYRKGADIVANMVKRNTLRPSDKDKPEELAAKLAECDKEITSLQHGGTAAK